MPNLAELAKAIHKAATPSNHTIMIYGDAKTGKTRLAATIARLPSCKKVYWFDGENGSSVLLTMLKDGDLTQEQAAKITLFKMLDTPEKPRFMETMTKILCVSKPHKICDAHGRIACPDCDKAKLPFTDFDKSTCGSGDWIVIDSGSQLADSMMAFLTISQAIGYKPDWDEYGPQGLMLKDCFSTIQAAETNYIVTAKVLPVSANPPVKKGTSAPISLIKIDGKDRFYPAIGTKTFSMTVGGYFGTVCFLEKKLGGHVGGSATDYDSDLVVGSRYGFRLEAQEKNKLDLSVLLSSADAFKENAETK